MIVYKGINHPNLCDVMGHMTPRHYVAKCDDGSYQFLHANFGWNTDNIVKAYILTFKKD